MTNSSDKREKRADRQSGLENGHEDSRFGGLGSIFTRFSRWTAKTTGHPASFFLAVTVVAVWAITGPIFAFSDTWQLVINTGTTIITFLMVFLIQSTQNRDTQAMQVKLDELLRSVKGAHNTLINLEEGTDQDLDEIKAQYEELARRARDKVEQGIPDVGTPSLEAAVSRVEKQADEIEERADKIEEQVRHVKKRQADSEGGETERDEKVESKGRNEG